MRKSISLQIKLILILLLSAIIPLVGMMVYSILNSNEALKNAENNKLVAIRDIKKQEISDLFVDMNNDLKFLVETSNTIKTAVVDFIQYHNEMGIQENENFDDSSSKPNLTKTYREIHDALNEYIKKYNDIRDYLDIYIICKKHGHVMYSFSEKSDFKENLRYGKYKDSVLADLWNETAKTNAEYLTDMKNYAPANNLPAMFYGAPIKVNGETLAILAVQLNEGKINDIMQSETGMGKTGETYLVGQDFLLRSDSRLIMKNENNLSLMSQKADMEQVKKAINESKTGIMNSVNYKNLKVLSAYTPVTIGNLRWAVIAEVEESEAYSAVNRLTFTSLILLAIVLVVLVIIGLLFARSISKPVSNITGTLENSSAQIATASNHLSSSSQEIANGATEQASSIEETTSSMEELASMVKQNAQNAKEATVLADKASEASESGYSQMENMLDSMTEINKSSDNIQKIIKVIDDIAFQTNILALNAAVEAARAGEAGMGFAVVADEVKNLANKCTEAAKETANMIDDSIKKTQGGLDIAAKLAEVFKEILTNSRKVSGMVKEVETASRQQDTGINQVNKAIIQFDEIVQSNASSAEETASSAEELLAQVDMLNSVVNNLVLIVTGKENINNVRNIKGLPENEDRMSNNQSLKNKPLKKQDENKKMVIDNEKLIPFEEDEEFDLLQ